MKAQSRSSTAARAAVPVLVLLAAACGGGEGGGTEAQTGAGSGESCYEGQTATFVVPYPPGGGYDVVARAFAPGLEEELGATVVVQNQPGAGGLTATNTLYEGEPDGLTFAILPGIGVLAAALAEVQGAAYDPVEFSFIARVAPDERLMVTGPDSGFRTVEDVLTADEPVRFAATGPGGGDYIDATIVPEILGLESELVSGFDGSGATALAVTAGDVDAVFSSAAGLLAAVEAGDLVPLVVATEERAQDLPDVPTVLELPDLDENQRALAEAHAQLANAGRTIAAPPGVDEDCLAELEAAFEAATENPQVTDALEQANEHVAFLPGAELADVYRSVMEESPEEYVALVTEAFEGQ
jgi:tripartite-type tricarboxylate transporter receptor subunit TctC